MTVGHKNAAFPGDGFGTAASILQGVPLLTNEWVVDTTNVAARQVHDNTGVQFIRVFAIGCDCYYTFGPDVNTPVPTVNDLLLLAGAVYDGYLLTTQQWVRAKAKTGSGSFRVELLG